MLQASKQSSEDSKLLQLSILGIKEQLLESNKYIEDAISDIRDSEETSTKRLFNIADSLQVQFNGLALFFFLYVMNSWRVHIFIAHISFLRFLTYWLVNILGNVNTNKMQLILNKFRFLLAGTPGIDY
jgi:hypothetical protein